MMLEVESKTYFLTIREFGLDALACRTLGEKPGITCSHKAMSKADCGMCVAHEPKSIFFIFVFSNSLILDKNIRVNPCNPCSKIKVFVFVSVFVINN